MCDTCQQVWALGAFLRVLKFPSSLSPIVSNHLKVEALATKLTSQLVVLLMRPRSSYFRPCCQLSHLFRILGNRQSPSAARWGTMLESSSQTIPHTSTTMANLARRLEKTWHSDACRSVLFAYIYSSSCWLFLSSWNKSSFLDPLHGCPKRLQWWIPRYITRLTHWFIDTQSSTEAQANCSFCTITKDTLFAQFEHTYITSHLYFRDVFICVSTSSMTFIHSPSPRSLGFINK